MKNNNTLMTPKIGMDEDGDIPPCSVMQGREYAEKWDAWKEKKYGGKQKALPTVERFKHRWSSKKVSVAPTVAPKYIVPPATTKDSKSWWLRLFSCYCFRGSPVQPPALTSVQPVVDARLRRPSPL